jgi:putative thioredoxin
MSESPYVVNVTESTFENVVLAGSMERPVLVDFWADWCAPCRQLMPLLAKLADEFAGAFLLAKVDTEAERNLAAAFGIRSLPTVQLFKDGNPVDQFMGALPEGEIRAFLARHIENETDLRLAELDELIQRGDLVAAERLLETIRSDGEDHPQTFLAEARLKLARGEHEAAAGMLDRAPVELASDPRLAELRGRAGFAAAAATAPARPDCEARLAADPADSEARYGLAVHQVLAGEYEAALETLLALMRSDRGYGDDAARKGMVMIFDLLGEHALVQTYRGKLARLLY